MGSWPTSNSPSQIRKILVRHPAEEEQVPVLLRKSGGPMGATAQAV